jgi:hypothetical protein
MVDPQMDSTWATRELPILASALRQLDTGQQFASLEGIREEVGLSVAQMRAGVKALESASPPYLATHTMHEGPARVGGFVTGVSERARRELGTWPTSTSVFDGLVTALRDAAENEPTPDKKTRLKGTVEVLTGFARDVAVTAIASKVDGKI